MNNELLYCLEKLDMIGDANHVSGLETVQSTNANKVLPPEEIIALENAKKYNAHYVYFRRFENRPSVPQIYLYDFTNELGIIEDQLTDLHKQLYSSGQVPMFFVFTKIDIRIFNCFERPAEGKRLKYTPLTTIKFASDLSEKIDISNHEKFTAFSGKAFDNGSFWESSKYSNQFKFSNSAHEKLLTELKHALKDIINQGILPANFARKIMVVSILIKYLEEREDENGNKVFPSGFFKKFASKAKKFTDILDERGAYLKLLDFLAEHFNGGVFKIDDNERNFIKNKDFSRFGQFLDGDIDGVQFVFWRLYSFNDLPVELISNIYEEFLGKKPGVVYTPPYLVNFLLDEAMPLDNENTNYKVLDPSCGSGVFLVGAYRRLIYRWRKKNNWKRPNLHTLKKLLRENIFGVELNKEAADLTVFSLSLALCDELTPLQIWKDLKFDDLHDTNILHDDFFDVLSKKDFHEKFDLIIGNPPFESKLTDSAKKIETLVRKTRTIPDKETGKSKDIFIKLPDNQISLLFLEQSVNLAKKGGLICLIQPSGPLLYNNSSFNFRQLLLKRFNIPQIIDFTHISRVLFTSGKGSDRRGDVATAAIFLINEHAKNNHILHVIPKRTKTNKEKLFFELDTYDFHKVSRLLAINDSLIWKSNFLGGGRIHQLISSFYSFPKLKDLLTKKLEEGWDFGEGFIRGNKTDKLASHLTNKDAILAPNFNSTKFETTILKDEYFKRPKKPDFFKAPLLLIKEVIEANSGEIPIAFVEENISFDSRILGIRCPSNQKQELLSIYKILKENNKLFSFFIAGTSSQYLINLSSAIRADDIYNIPYDESMSLEKLGKYDNVIIDDLFQYYFEFRRNGEKSTIAIQDVTKQNLIEFSDVFCEVLKSVFKSIKPFKYFETTSYICLPFYFGEKPNIDFSNSENSEKHIDRLIQKNFGISLRLTRIVRLYEGNVIYIIKPKKLRYWLKSIALRDADETFSDLRKQGF